MKLRARYTALFAILAAATVVVLVVVSDAVVGKAVSERISERFGRELEHLAGDLPRIPAEDRAEFLRASARQLECRITLIGPDGTVLDDTDFRPSEIATIENHSNREEVRQASRGGEVQQRLSQQPTVAFSHAPG